MTATESRPRITFVGAGGLIFPLRVMVDVLSYPALQECELVLHDVDARRLQRTKSMLDDIIERHGLPTVASATLDRQEALRGAAYVIITFEIGGLDAIRLDIEIPRRYGVDQTFGDTLGPGGVFRALRTAPLLQEIAAEIDHLAPGATMIQYSNPMAINCRIAREAGARVVGLCHSIQETSRKIIGHAGLDPESVEFRAAGINHLAWFTEFTRAGIDVYPEIRQAVLERYPQPDIINLDGSLKAQPGQWEPLDERPRQDDLVRAEMLRTFGYFQTESSHHTSEYLPWFRKSDAITTAYLPRRNDYLQHLLDRDENTFNQRLAGIGRDRLDRSLEWCAPLIAGLEGHEPTVIYGNVGNRMPDGGLAVEGLPPEATVEVACRVDADGIHPLPFGALPPQCLAVCMSNVSVQLLAANGILGRDRGAVMHALALDPYTAMTLTLPEIRHMVDALFEAQARWLPAFAPSVSAIRAA